MAVKSKVLYQTDLLVEGSTDPLIGYVLIQTGVTSLEVGDSTNTAPTDVSANTTQPIRASGARKYGITARHIVIARIAGSSPNQYREYRRVVALTPTFFQTALSSLGAEVTYETLTDWFVVGGQAERYRLNLSAD